MRIDFAISFHFDGQQRRRSPSLSTGHFRHRAHPAPLSSCTWPLPRPSRHLLMHDHARSALRHRGVLSRAPRICPLRDAADLARIFRCADRGRQPHITGCHSAEMDRTRSLLGAEASRHLRACGCRLHSIRSISASCCSSGHPRVFINRAFSTIASSSYAQADSQPPFIARMYHCATTGAWELRRNELGASSRGSPRRFAPADSTPFNIRLPAAK